MKENALKMIEAFGQSVWLDFLSRNMLTSGQLRQLIEEDGLSGVTSNPTIFEKAITGSRDYDDAIRRLAREGRSAAQIYDQLTVEDIRHAADLFRPTFDRLKGMDGFVNLEVSPMLAHDTDKTIAEARRLWNAVGRPNVMIKVPGTREGLPAIRQLIGEGININITLLFGLPRYHDVAEAYIGGLESRASSGKPVDGLTSVASFFLSRIDTLIDPMLEKLMGASSPKQAIAESLHGQIAIASAKTAYRISQEIFGNSRWAKLSALGARTQRLLWASTSTKNPAYSDLKYVESLIGPSTINTMPLETIEAYRDHGVPASRLNEDADTADDTLRSLREVEIDLDACTQQLEDEGVQKFVKAYEHATDAVKEKQIAAMREPMGRRSHGPAKRGTPAGRRHTEG